MSRIASHWRIWPVLLVATLVACSTPAAPAAPTVAPSAPITATPTSQPAASRPAFDQDPAFGGARAKAHDTVLATTIGSRPAGSQNFSRAADYAANQLASLGYTVERQPFSFVENEVKRQEVSRPGEKPFESAPLQNSGSGDVDAPIVVAGLGQPTDFPADTAGKVALIARGGSIPFSDKVAAATKAGAAAVVISNSDPGMFRGSLASPVDVPVLSISKESGDALRSAGSATLHVVVDIQRNEIQSENVIATRAGGIGVLVFGAHLDTVAAGPGANDNGSGSASVLELARALALRPTTSELRFALFGAEENGPIGSRNYVRSLSAADKARIHAMVNMDMVGVGDTFLIGGTAAVTKPLRDAATSAGQAIKAMGDDLLGASDHASFIQAGIPAAFLYWSNDPDYHQAGDVAGNVRVDRLQTTGDVVMAAISALDGE